MAPKEQAEFPAAAPEYRLARQRCAVACHNYNLQPEDASPTERAALYHAIISSNAEPSKLQADELDSHDQLVPDSEHATHFVSNNGTSRRKSRSLIDSPLSLMSIPGPGSAPDAAILDPSTDGSESTSSTPASTAPSDSFPTSKRFPGQGHTPYIKPPLYVDYGCRLHIGTSTFINRNCTILDTPIRTVSIGERCLIGPDFSVYAVTHPLDFQLRQGPTGAPSFGLDVTIEDDCWIGGHVTILGGVTIGKGCVIGANSLVTKDIPAYHLAYGTPARVVRRISTMEQSSTTSLGYISQVDSKPLAHRFLRWLMRHGNIQVGCSLWALGGCVLTVATAFILKRYLLAYFAG